MPRMHYGTVAPLVKSLAKKHGVTYRCKPLFTAFADIVRYATTIVRFVGGGVTLVVFFPFFSFFYIGK